LLGFREDDTQEIIYYVNLEALWIIIHLSSTSKEEDVVKLLATDYDQY
jgi:hypothetical protein